MLRERTTEDAAAEADTLAPPARSAWQAGMSLPGDLRLLERLGAGGMAEVWKAWSLRLHRAAAVKRLLPSGSGPVDWQDRVLREARAAARLRHPAVVEIYDCAVDPAGQPFVAMEWIEGVDLASLVERHGRLPAEVAARLLLPIAGGLSAIHRRGVVHGDVKPANILFGRNRGSPVRQVKLIDFGIARVDGGGVTSRNALTLEYAAPEQMGGARPSVQTEQWSFCATLYEVCTGRVPFEGDTLAAVADSIRNAPLPFPRDVDLDGGLFRVMARGMRKKPEDRYASMGELGRALAAWLLTRGVRSDALGRAIRASARRQSAEEEEDPNAGSSDDR